MNLCKSFIFNVYCFSYFHGLPKFEEFLAQVKDGLTSRFPVDFLSRRSADGEFGEFGLVAFLLDGFLRDGVQRLRKPEIRKSKRGRKAPAGSQRYEINKGEERFLASLEVTVRVEPNGPLSGG